MTNIRLLAFPLLLLPLMLGSKVQASDSAKPTGQVAAPNLVELKVATKLGSQPAGVSYDLAWGVCSKDALQLLTSDEVRRFIAKTPDVSDCEPARPLPEAGRAEYPAELIEANQSGSAHVLARIGDNGRVVEAQAVCVSDRAFASLAESTARSLRFEPARCGAERLLPVSSVILVPVSYDVELKKTFMR